MSAAPGSPTLDQLRVLVEVVEAGSFTAAAKRLNRAISVISYTVGNLESQLGVALFERGATRRPQLTEAGRVVLAEARTVIGNVGGLRAKVAGMLQGLEGELHLALDSLLAPDRVIDALTAFSGAFPTVALHLHVETLGAVASLVLDKVASIGISGPFTAEYDFLSRIGVGRVRMVPVAGRHHALAASPPRGHDPGAARDHVQLVVTDRSPLTRGRDFSVSACRTWRLADLSVKHSLLRAGIGWGMMPLAMVRDDLAAGVLVELALPDVVAFDYPLDAVHRRDTPPGPGRDLADRALPWACGGLRCHLGDHPSSTFIPLMTAGRSPTRAIQSRVAGDAAKCLRARRPSPLRPRAPRVGDDVGDRVRLARHVRHLSEPPFQHAEQALALGREALDGERRPLLRSHGEEVQLPSIGPSPPMDQCSHSSTDQCAEPSLGAGARSCARGMSGWRRSRTGSGGRRGVVVDERRDLVVGRELEEGGIELLVGGEIDGLDLVGPSRLPPA